MHAVHIRTFDEPGIVYMAGDTQTVTPGVGGEKIGRLHLPNLAANVGAVRVPILIDEFTKAPV
jgi:hypothetical protein